MTTSITILAVTRQKQCILTTFPIRPENNYVCRTCLRPTNVSRPIGSNSIDYILLKDIDNMQQCVRPFNLIYFKYPSAMQRALQRCDISLVVCLYLLTTYYLPPDKKKYLFGIASFELKSCARLCMDCALHERLNTTSDHDKTLNVKRMGCDLLKM